MSNLDFLRTGPYCWVSKGGKHIKRAGISECWFADGLVFGAIG